MSEKTQWNPAGIPALEQPRPPTFQPAGRSWAEYQAKQYGASIAGKIDTARGLLPYVSQDQGAKLLTDADIAGQQIRLQVRLPDVDRMGELLIATVDGEGVDITAISPQNTEVSVRLRIDDLSRALYAASHFDVPAEDK